MLLESLRWLRPEFLERDGHLKNIRAELDKQFWHNINNVTLAGGGNANYVIAKDDIGNWYVKSYSTDPSQVYRSAASLGMFALGGKMDLNLFDRLDEERRLKKQIDAKDDVQGARTRLDQLRNEKPSTTNSSLGKVFVSYRDVYVAKTKEASESLSGEIKEEAKFRQRVADSWKATLKDSTIKLGEKSLSDLTGPLLSTRYETLKNQGKALSESSKNVDAGSRTLYAGFRALVEFRDGLRTDLDALLKMEADRLTGIQANKQGVVEARQRDLESATRGVLEATTLRDAIKSNGGDTGIVDNRRSQLLDQENKAKADLDSAKADLAVASKNVSELVGAWKQLKADVARETNILLRKLAGSQLHAATELETAANFVGQAAGK